MNEQMIYMTQELCDRLRAMGISLSEAQTEKMERFAQMLVAANEQFNLTAITEPEEFGVKHLIDSLSVMRVCDLAGSKVLDLGSGAGFPGIPLAIAIEDMEITLVDSLNKRVGFLHDVIDALSLTNAQAIHARAEDLAKSAEHREQYDVCTSRAVAALPTLSEYCMPFVRCGGKFIAYKGAKAAEEAQEAQKAIRILGGSEPVIETFAIADTAADRAFVIVEKVAPTPDKYPRKAGKPAKSPLISK